MAKSLRTNFIYNIINTVSGLVFPLITYPYAFRILMVEGIGTVNFLYSIISYVILLTSLGIPLYGIREIARVRDDKRELTKTTFELLSLNLLLNVIGYIIIFILAFSVPELKENIGLFLLLSTSVVLTTLGCQWFYSGIEDFKFVAIRGLVVRVICTAFLFLVVKSKDDLFWYALYTVLVSTGNYLVNFICLKNRISIGVVKFEELELWKHVKPACTIFVFNLVTSIYLNLDKVMLGFIQNSEAVGYYTASTQLSHILLTIVTALGAVMLPRSSNLIKQGAFDDFYRLANKSYNFILMLALPLCVGCIVMSPVLIHIFCGDGYDPSITTLRIICPIIIAIGMSNLIGLQMLYPLGLIKIVIISTCVGAVVNFVLNACLIPYFSQDGAAVATLAAEISVTLLQIVMARKHIKFELISEDFAKYLLSAFLMGAICTVLMKIEVADIIKLVYVPISGVIIYSLLMVVFREPFAVEAISILKSKFKL